MIFDFFHDLKDQKIEKLYDVADVTDGFYYWFWKFLNFCLTIFKYDGLPETLPQREIESNLLLTNHDVIFDYNGKLITTNVNIYGFDNYYNPTNGCYANPRLQSKSLDLTENGNACIIYNSSLKDNILYLKSDGSMMSFIKRYARLMADIESTIDIYMVNSRLTSYPVASTENVVQNLQSFFKKLKAGKRAIITDDTIIQQFRSEDITRYNQHDGINDWLVARDKILEMFFRDIGVKFYNPKKAQVSEDELQVNNQMLVISLDDMLQERKRGIEKVNAKFGTNITVDISDSFKIKEVNENVENNGFSE